MAENRKKRAPFFATARGLVFSAMVLFVVSAVCAATALLGLQQALFEDERQRILVSYAAYLPAILLAMAGVTQLIIGSVRWAMFGGDSVGVPSGAAVETELLESINARLLLSDTAKRIAYRDEDIELLKKTIKDDVAARRYDSAIVLVNELADTYGVKHEAEAFRESILGARRAEMETQVTSALTRLKDVVSMRDFDVAVAEAQKIRRLYPESTLAQEAPNRVMQARESYKQDLERQFLEASEQDDVDRAMKLLKEMDHYLTEEEAAPFVETARGVIGKARDNLGVQFKLAVHDREWVTAVNVGEQIIREFPNSKMADEVRSMLDLLRERAAGQHAAAAGR